MSGDWAGDTDKELRTWLIIIITVFLIIVVGGYLLTGKEFFSGAFFVILLVFGSPFWIMGIQIAYELYDRRTYNDPVRKAKREKERQAVVGNEKSYPSDWDTTTARIRKRDGYRCKNCGTSGVELHVHHIVPLSKGGTNSDGNLATLCNECHKKIHPRMR